MGRTHTMTKAERNAPRRLDPTARKAGPTPKRPGTRSKRYGPRGLTDFALREIGEKRRRVREHMTRTRVLRLISARQDAAANDLAVSIWEKHYGGAEGGRLRGRFVPRRPEPGSWPTLARRGTA